MVNQVVSRHSVPLELHTYMCFKMKINIRGKIRVKIVSQITSQITNQGKNYESRLFQELSWMLGIKKLGQLLFIRSQIERQTLQYLSKFVENQRDWDRWVPLGFFLAYRSSKHEITNVTPAKLYFGRDLDLPLDLLQGTSPSYGFSESVDEYVRDLREKLDEIHQGVRERLKMRFSRTKGS